MDGNDSVASTSAGIDPAAAVGADRDTGGVTVDYSPDEEDLDEAAAAAAAEATRDTLADGLVTRLLRPCVDRLDASVQCTRLSQLDLKLQLDSLAAELKRLSLAQTDYLFSVPTTQSPALADKTNPPTTPTNTSALLDGYARRLCGARAKIAVVGNILESTQERLRVLSQRIGREHNNRRSLLEPSTVIPGTTVEEPVLESIINKESDSDNEEDNQHKEDGIYSDHEDNQEPTSIDNSAVITIPQATTESPIS